MDACISCGRELSSDEIGLYKKMINRGSTRFLCIDCLSKETNLPVSELRRKIEQFRAMGCTLFVPLPHEIQEKLDRGEI